MKGKLIVGVLALLVGGVALGAGQPQVNAATTYKVVKTKTYNDVPFHAKDVKKTAYMWNTAHTKKLHNLKKIIRKQPGTCRKVLSYRPVKSRVFTIKSSTIPGRSAASFGAAI